MKYLYFLIVPLLLFTSGTFATNENSLPFFLDADHLPNADTSIKKVAISVAPGHGIILADQELTFDLPLLPTPGQGSLEITFQVDADTPNDPEHPFLRLGNAHTEETSHLNIFKARRRWIVRFNDDNGNSVDLGFSTRGIRPGDWLNLNIGWNTEANVSLFWISLNGEIVDLENGFPFKSSPDQLILGGPEWKGILANITVNPQTTLPNELKPGERSILVDGSNNQGILYPFWKVANFSLHETPSFSQKTDQQILLSRAPFTHEVVVDYILGGRHKGGEEYYLGQGPNGELLTDFTGLIQRVRNVLQAGYRPWIGLENVPPLMSDPPQWNEYGNSKPPANMSLFHRYTRLAIEALVHEFGYKEAASWHYFIATEPDLNPDHWSESKESFLTLLDHTQAALLEVIPEAQVSPGNILNPSFILAPPPKDEEGLNIVRSRNQWGLDIIDHMAQGNSPAKRKMDFFSASWYSGLGRPLDSFERAVSVMRERLGKYPKYKDIPIDIREFGILFDDKGNRLFAGDASEWSASFYAAIARKVYDLNVRYVFEWDHATLGVLHPRGQVIRMLDQMAGGELLAVQTQGAKSSAECGVIASQANGAIYLLVYNHHHLRNATVSETIHLDITHPAFETNNSYQLSEWIIDKDKGTWVYAFLEDAKAAGKIPLARAGLYEASPNRLLGQGGLELFKEHIEKYRAISAPVQTMNQTPIPVEDGHIRWDLEMPSHSVCLLKLVPQKR